MQWADVTKRPPERTLRQFAGLALVFFGGLAAWRAWHGQVDLRTATLAILGLGIGIVGLAWPAAVRLVYTGWMIAAFPIGWVVSKLMMAIMFFGVFTPVAVIFRLMGRDALQLRRPSGSSYWVGKTGAASVEEYFRQS